MLDSYTNGQWASAAIEAMTTAAAQRDPYVLMRPRVFPDGGVWCALYGENVQEGVAGFGATPALACADFDKNWMNQRLSISAALAGGVDAPQGQSDAGANHNERERHLGLDARLRAAGMAGLLAEIRNSNYARDMDDDLKDRIDIALSDQGRAVTAATVSAIDASYEAIDGVEGQKR